MRVVESFLVRHSVSDVMFTFNLGLVPGDGGPVGSAVLSIGVTGSHEVRICSFFPTSGEGGTYLRS